MESAIRFLLIAGTVSLLVQLANARAQGDLDTLIGQVFKRPETGGNPNSEQPTEERNQDPGEGYNPLDCQCVPYYLCQNNTIITDGVGLIDIRSGFLPSNQPCPCPASNTPG
jgi:hypothetical protein